MISHKHIQCTNGSRIYGDMQNKPYVETRKYASHKQRKQKC